jgi:DNA-binding CsgD family transcriptional regulator
LEQSGRWDEAVALSLDLLHLSGASPSNRMCAMSRLGTIGSRRGEPGAWEHLDAAMAVAIGTNEPQNIVPARLARAEAHWLAGDRASACREAELADNVVAGCDEWDRGAVARWLFRTGSPRPPRGALAEPYRLEQAGQYEAAADLWQRYDSPYSAALALLDSGDEAALRRALGVLQELGATAVERVARERLRSLGVRTIPLGARPSTRDSPLGLTRREHEVLDLICDGLTNAQIAKKLFISAKTVDHHVSAVLAKLGVHSRGSAASAAIRLGLADASGR